jgi:hypothetical protein
MDMHKCSICQEEKPVNPQNWKTYNRKDISGKPFTYTCFKRCLQCFNKERRETEDKEAKKQSNIKYKLNNKERIQQKSKDYLKKNSETINKKRRLAYRQNEEIRIKNVQRVTLFRNNNIYYKINHGISSVIRRSIHDKNNCPVFSLLGYSLEELMSHLQSQFQEGMSWNNYGEWHIDHIKPVCSFNFQSKHDAEFKLCWQLSNLRPLWAKDNLRKGAIDKLSKYQKPLTS